MTDMKIELDQLISKLEDAHKQLKDVKARETEMSNQLQDQTQKV